MVAGWLQLRALGDLACSRAFGFAGEENESCLQFGHWGYRYNLLRFRLCD